MPVDLPVSFIPLVLSPISFAFDYIGSKAHKRNPDDFFVIQARVFIIIYDNSEPGLSFSDKIL